MTDTTELAVATPAQEIAIRQIFDRVTIWHGDLTAPQLAMAAGWTYDNYSTLPPEQHSGDWWWSHPKLTSRDKLFREADQLVSAMQLAKSMTYDEFRATVQTGSGCLMVRWQGMWLGVELDGYTHS